MPYNPKTFYYSGLQLSIARSKVAQASSLCVSQVTQAGSLCYFDAQLQTAMNAYHGLRQQPASSASSL